MYDIHLCHSGGSETWKLELSRSNVFHKKVVFHFPQDIGLFEAGGTYLIDFDDDQQYHSVSFPNNGYTVEYSTIGTKDVKINDSSQEYDMFEFNLKEENSPYNAPDIVWSLETLEQYEPLSGQYPEGSPYASASYGQARAYIRFGDGNQALTRPVIFVEGLDFGTKIYRDPDNNNAIIRYGSNGWDNLSMGSSESNLPDGEEELFKYMPEQFQSFTEAGYDLIVLDFADGATYIQKNAELLKVLLRRVNITKQADNDGVLHENIVVGASMGGVISRYALAQMEQDGEAHCTGTFVSFDSPQQGANIPLGLQSLIWFNGTFFDSNATDRDIEVGKALWENLNRPAPRQLLFETLLSAFQKGMLNLHCFVDDGLPFYWEFEDFEDLSIDYSLLHTSLFSELDDLGYPQKTWNIALSNGKADGQNVGFDPGATLLDADRWFGSIAGMAFKTKIWALNGTSYSDEDFGESFSSDKTIFYARRPLDFNLLGAPNLRVVAGIELTGDFPVWDGAPGSVRRDIGNLIVPSISNVEQLGEGAINYSFPHATFMPTISSLDIDTDDLFFNAGSINPDNPNSNLTPFSKIFLPETFEAHVATNEANRTWVNEQISYTLHDLAGIGVLPNSNGATYNYGHALKSISQTTINNGGFLRINDEGNTSYLNEVEANRKSFSVYTSDCNNGNIIIQDGGSIIMGSDPNDSSNKQGNLHITSGSKLQVESGGILRLQRGSQLIIESGGVLEIDEGAKIDLWWSASTIHIKEGGELILNGDFKFSGSGFFQFDKGHIFTQNTKLVLKGSGSRFLQLNDGAILDINHHGLDLQNGTVRYAKGTTLKTGTGADIWIEQVNMEGLENEPAENTALHINNANKVYLLFCTFSNLHTGVITNNSQLEIPFYIIHSQFNDCGNGVLASQTPGISIRNSTFNVGDIAYVSAIDLSNLEYGGINACTINGYINNNTIGSVELTNIDRMYISSTHVSGNHTGLSLRNVEALRIYGGYIGNNDIGVKIPTMFDGSENISNLFLFSQAKVNENQIGIHFEAGGGEVQSSLDVYYGMLTMDCAELYSNGTGVLGDDVILNIDAIINSNTDDPEKLRSNKIHGSGIYFDICYIELIEEVTEVLARGNYWGGAAPSFWKYKVNNPNITEGCASWGGILNSENFITIEPTDCNDVISDPVPDDTKVASFPFINLPEVTYTNFPSNSCNLLSTPSFDPTDAIHYNAYNLFRAGMDEQARQIFGQTASVSPEEQASTSSKCRHYINVAKVMSVGQESGIMENLQNEYYGGTPSQEYSYSIFPNPANTNFTIKYYGGAFQLKIYDFFGRLIDSNSYNDIARVNSENWLSGIYIIEIYDYRTNESYKEKVIITD